MNGAEHEKLIQSGQEMLIDLTVNLPYYGQFLLFLNYYDRKDLNTCGVNVTSKGMNFYYNSKFLDGKTQKEVNFIVLHEIFHLLWSHPKRTITGQYEHKLANIAQDMIINHIIWEDISHSFVDIPRNDKGENMALFIPKEYEGSLIFEELYEWLRDERDKRRNAKKCQTCSGSGKDPKGNAKCQSNSKDDSKEEGSGGDSKGDGGGDKDQECPDCNGSGNQPGNKPHYGKYGKYPSKKEKEKDDSIDTYSLDHILDNLDENNGEYLDQHIDDTVPEEMKEAVVKDVMERLRARGFESGNITQSLDKLRKKKKDYLSHIKRSLSSQIFGSIKQKTITKPNRRGIVGLKGNRKIKTRITVILDTSGSMGGTFERVLSYIYRNDIEIDLIEADTNVKWIQRIKNKQKLASLPIKGLGGTILQPAIDVVVDKFNNSNLLILTDGYCDNLDVSQVRGNVLMISVGVKVPIRATNGKIKQIIVEPTEK